MDLKAELASCLEKQEKLKEIFRSCSSNELKYQKIIELGKSLPPFDTSHQTPLNIVAGCQSIMYLHSHLQDSKVIFKVGSEALISSGLAAILVYVYSGESPETIIKAPATFLEELGIYGSLTPGRSNGLSSLYLRMKQDALKLLLTAKNNLPK